ncbi:DNA helicase IV [Vibrio sp. SCSIO 43137]|uniref:DNA helicase IV n=1 Tax=Vibrio sp. SCSIO 43137 TaxID=3021011 RepID=UPI0023079092|nr:DNA helicase IV [Vibrio sp. SCSIO 43137]WCE31445.1 DNA helicase IV [Vibrio sp. SCSIO 43137]
MLTNKQTDVGTKAEIKASPSAQFFFQNEYQQIRLESNTLIVSSALKEERIPFAVWSGELNLKRGLLWGAITLYSSEEGGVRNGWRIQGLPWEECREFARNALRQYEEWHLTQCRQLLERKPEWQQQLDLLIKQPAYLPDSCVHNWRDMVAGQLEEMGMTLDEAKARLRGQLDFVSTWIEQSEQRVDERNDHWLEQERPNWEVLFNQIESSPLNVSQQQAVLLNNDHNLVLAGAGTGKTSVLTSRIAYLLQSHLAQADELLMLAFGRKAAEEMKQRLSDKIGLAAEKVSVNTFHQLGLKIVNSVEEAPAVISPLATDSAEKKAWCSEWLKQHWQVNANYKRWQKHLSKWPIAYLKGDEELEHQTENPKLIQWLISQLDFLCQTHKPKKELQELLVEHRDYPRLNNELALIWPCYQHWQKTLKERGEIDFYLMISQATKYVKSGKFKSPWRYIMVDEYQDISPDRVELLEALCTNRKGEKHASLFAVGDDWQAIYQFAGADVDLTTGFAERFTSSTVHYLDTTYRFNSKIAEVANRFIQQNPYQLEKELVSNKVQKQKAVYVISVKQIEKALSALNQKMQQGASVMLLGRNHYHKPAHFDEWQKAFANLSFEFQTCHASKGSEADYVFIVALDDGQFPASERQPHLDAVIGASKQTYADAEERRLFYVALTRAKQKVWLVHGAAPSRFIQELTDNDYAVINRG